MNMLSMISPSTSATSFFQHDGLARLGDQVHPDGAGPVQRQPLLAVIEVAVAHVSPSGVRDAGTTR